MNPEGKPLLRITAHTLGCRLNRFESDGILSDLLQSGKYRLAAPGEQTDIALVNTCTVTNQADSRNRYIIRRIKRENPDVKIVVTGCYAQTDPEKLRDLPGVVAVAGNDRKSSLMELIDALSVDAVDGTVALEPALHFSNKIHSLSHPQHHQHDPYDLPVMQSPFSYGNTLPVGHTRAYLKIQDGCDRKCSYCKIPQARGRGTSRPLADVLKHVLILESSGVPEIVLTGVNLGWYKDGKSGVRFNELLERILSSLNRARLRISSLEPCDLDAGLAALTLHKRCCDFLHVPLQSGSRQILRAMRRTYNPDSFRMRVQMALEQNPNLFLGTDVIAGFPGETEKEFQETLDLLEELPFANIHAFRFSPRSGTPASTMADLPDSKIVRERMEILNDMKERKYRDYARRYFGTIREMAVEGSDPAHESRHEIVGLTDNFLRVVIPRHPSIEKVDVQWKPGSLMMVRLLDFDAGGRIQVEPLLS